MLTTGSVMMAIRERAAQEIPELKRVYIGRVPKDFKRPCLQIEPVTTKWADGNKNLVNTTEYFTLTVYIPTDDYDYSATDPLIALQGKTMALFRRGYLPVGDRAVRVKASTGGSDPDRAYVDVQFEYFEVRDDTPDDTPLMEHVRLDFNHGKE